MTRSPSHLRLGLTTLVVFVAHFLFAGMDALGNVYSSKAHIYGTQPAPFIVEDWPAWKQFAVVLGYPGSYILRNSASTESEAWLVVMATSVLWTIVLVGAWCLVRSAIRSTLPARPGPP